jgi:putative ABC transport system substrate-binding protein
VIAARQATATVPIVVGATAGDLVRQGLVASLARPGGNVTGFTISTGPELYGKRLELLREAVPSMMRVAVVRNPRNETSQMMLASIDTAAKTLGIQVKLIEAGGADEIEHAFSRAARSRAGGVLMVADAFLWSQRGRIVALAARQRIPVIYPEVEFVEVGGLMGYGPNVTDNFRRAAVYVDKILRGAKPADLPVEQPTKFELVINLTTAKALALTIPPSLLARADVVIQ